METGGVAALASNNFWAAFFFRSLSYLPGLCFLFGPRPSSNPVGRWVVVETGGLVVGGRRGVVVETGGVVVETGGVVVETGGVVVGGRRGVVGGGEGVVGGSRVILLAP